MPHRAMMEILYLEMDALKCVLSSVGLIVRATILDQARALRFAAMGSEPVLKVVMMGTMWILTAVARHAP